MDPCTVYKHFTIQILMAGKTVDVFMALKKLTVLFGGLPERTFVYVFMIELPAQVKQLSEQHQLSNYLSTHRSLLGMKQRAQSGHTNPLSLDPRAKVNCFRCGWIGYIT